MAFFPGAENSPLALRILIFRKKILQQSVHTAKET